MKKKALTPNQIARMPKAARPISIEPLEPEKIRAKYSDRRRFDKTKKDRDGGSHQRSRERKMIPIRCTSSHNPGSSTERGQEYWGRG